MKLVVEERISEDIGTMEITQDGEETEVFDPGKGPLDFTFPDVKAPDQLTAGKISFAWDGYNDNGQEISQGLYYLKISVKDKYGHVDAIIEDIQLVRNEEYARINIYNSSGELVRRMEKPKSPDTVVSVKNVNDLLKVGSGDIDIMYSDGGEHMTWDGKTYEGNLVSSGVYEVQVEVNDGAGYSVIASKTVNIINSVSEAEVLGEEVKAYPNPVVVTENNAGAKITIAWENVAQGTVKVKIYNMAGELVRVLNGDLISQQIEWDLKTGGGEGVSSGMYIILIEALKETGEAEKRVIKSVVIKQYNPDFGAVN